MLQTLVEGLQFPEAPRWHGGRLWFSDFYRHRVYSIDDTGTLREEAVVETRPSGLGWRPDGTLLVVSMHDKRLLGRRPFDMDLSTVADLSAHAGGYCNDMVVDAAGRAYIGNFGFDLYAREAPRETVLQRVDPDGSVHVAAEGLLFPNGTALTPDGRTLIVAETFGHRLTAFDVDPASGELGARRVFADLPEVFPDGLCLDDEGCIWVADARGHRVLRVREGAGTVDSISTGEHQSYACMLGGEDGCTLFVCTAPGIGSSAAARREGRIEFTRVSVPHAGCP